MLALLHLAHVGYVPLFTQDPSFNTFFAVSVATHVTVCEVDVTQANEFYTIHHSYRSTPVMKLITARQQCTAYQGLCYHFCRLHSNIRQTFYCNITGMSRDIGCSARLGV